MEAESADTWSNNYKNYATVLDFADETMQSGIGYDAVEDDLFNTYIKYENLNNLYSPGDMDEMDFDDQNLFKLAPSGIDFPNANKMAEMNDQRFILNEHGLLRPRQMTNNEFWSANKMTNEIEFLSEFGKNGYYGRIIQNNNESEYVLGPNQSHYYIDFVPRMEALNINSIEMTHDKAEVYPNNNIAPDFRAALSFEEKAANAADCYLVSKRLETSQRYKTSNHLDGPVPSNGTAEETHSGQMTNCSDLSSGFECDRNKFTSFTIDSKH